MQAPNGSFFGFSQIGGAHAQRLFSTKNSAPAKSEHRRFLQKLPRGHNAGIQPLLQPNTSLFQRHVMAHLDEIFRALGRGTEPFDGLGILAIEPIS